MVNAKRDYRLNDQENLEVAAVLSSKTPSDHCAAEAPPAEQW